MDVFFALLFVGVLAIPVMSIWALVAVSKLKKRVNFLEAALLEQSLTAKGAAKANSPAHTAPVTAPSSDTEAKTTVPAKQSKGETQSDAAETKPKVAASAQTTDAIAAKNVTRQSPAQAPSTPQSQALVFNQDRIEGLVKWLMQNWFYVVSAASLALAGIYLVIYSIEAGLLPPIVRILASVGFGAALIAVGEWIRRRFGDGESNTTAYLPSIFSGAGVVTLFGSALSARWLYDFIGAEGALFAMAGVGVLAILLGWLHGPLLAAIGILGATAAPFIIGGQSDDPWMLFVYFAVVVLAGLAIDTMRRWAWVSVISLFAGFTAGTLLTLASDGTIEPSFFAYCTALALMAMAVPVRSLFPHHQGAMVGLTLINRVKGTPWPEFPTRLAAGAIAAASVLIAVFAVSTNSAYHDLFWPAVLALGALILALLVWARNAPALADIVVLPAVALLPVIAAGAPLWFDLMEAAQQLEADVPLLASIIVGIGVLFTLCAAWRALRGGDSPIFFALMASLFAPSIAITLEVFWAPVEILGAYVWALHAMGIALIMVILSERFTKIDGPEHRERASFAALSALACIAFGAVIMFSSAALTLAIAVTVLAATWIDHKFKMPFMGFYVLAGVITTGFRLVVYPGVLWAIDAPLVDLLLSHLGAPVALAAAWMIAKRAGRNQTELLLETAVVSAIGVLLSVLLHRVTVHFGGDASLTSHWSLGLSGTIWLILGFVQVKRHELGGALALVRLGLGTIFLLLAAMHILNAASLGNPLWNADSRVIGPAFINSLAPAYLLPAGILILAVWWISSLTKLQRLGCIGTASALAGLWIGLVVRHFWRGAEGMPLPGIEQGELYSYTVLLLLVGSGLFYHSLARADAVLRKIGLVFIGLAVAKVFVVDIQGLGGLIRVLALLVLGLTLAGLAWLNRWAASRDVPTDPQTDIEDT